MSFPDGVWVLQLIVHCSDQSVWRWIRKARFLMGSLTAGGGLICLGGHTENLSLSPGAVVGRCPIFSPWTRRSHVLLAEGDLWFGELWFLIWNIEHRNASCFFSTWENTLFCIDASSGGSFLSFHSIDAKQILKFEELKSSFAELVQHPAALKAQRSLCSQKYEKKDTFEPVNHNFSWESEGACFSLIFRIYYYTHN